MRQFIAGRKRFIARAKTVYRKGVYRENGLSQGENGFIAR